MNNNKRMNLLCNNCVLIFYIRKNQNTLTAIESQSIKSAKRVKSQLVWSMTLTIWKVKVNLLQYIHWTQKKQSWEIIGSPN